MYIRSQVYETKCDQTDECSFYFMDELKTMENCITLRPSYYGQSPGPVLVVLLYYLQNMRCGPRGLGLFALQCL